MKTFEDMTKAELLEVVAKYDLMDQVKKLGPDPKKIKNELLIGVLNEYKDKKNGLAPKEIVEEIEEAPAVEDDKPRGHKMSVHDVKEYLNTALPAIVLDHDTSYEIKDDDENRVVEISWGNLTIGMTKEKIALHGKRQFITRGALTAMADMNLPRVKIAENGRTTFIKPKDRFTITEVDGFTQEELDALAKKNIQERMNY